MKIFATLVLISMCWVAAIPRAADPPTNAALATTVRNAGARADVRVDDGLISAFSEKARREPAAYQTSYASVPEETRVNRLAEYLKAKKSIAGTGDEKKLDGLTDFSWEFLGYDLTFVPLKFRVPEKTKLSTLETGGMTFNFSSSAPFINSGETLIIPTIQRSPSNKVTVGLQSDESKMIWSGVFTSKDVLVAVAGTTQGCEIDVRSSPAGATVLFNGREWTRKTNTRSVRSPGKYEVVVRMDGYKEWRETRFLDPGSAWTIDATLQKIP